MTGRALRVAWLSFWQAHSAPAPELSFPGPGTAVNALNHPQLDVVVAWDSDTGRGKDRAASLGLPFTADLNAIWSDASLDGVILASETTLHKELASQAAETGKHVFTSKVLAPTLSEATEIVHLTDAAGIALVTDMSWLAAPYLLRIAELVESGKLGKIANVRLNHFHSMATHACPVDGMGYFNEGNGFLRRDQAAGGALVDMCHQMYVLPKIVGGLPAGAYARMESISGRGDVEDTAVVVYDYKHGPYAIVEASWVTGPMTTQIEVNGTNGSVLYRDVTGIPAQTSLKVRTGDENQFTEVPIGEPGKKPLDVWIGAIRDGARPSENIQSALDLALLNEAAYRSAKSGSRVVLADI